jgi:2-iminobutanoate/2-iminopropanoate deaminase
MQTITTPNAPAAIGPYAQAVISGDLVFCSGQIPLCPVSGTVVEGGIREQTEQVMRNIAAVLEAAGSGLEKAVKTTCFLAAMDDFAVFNEVYATYFTGKPARSTVAAAGLPRGVRVEVEVIAQITSPRK